MTRINRTGINKHMSYTVKQLSDILHKNEKTCLRWIDAGLQIVPGSKKPILIMGSELTVFLRNKDAKKKVKLKRNEFYCLRCKAARPAKRGSVETLSDRKVGTCSVCSGKMTRIIKPYQKGLFDTPP
jgi:hypothetical protein